jgi:hypothetical protein
MQYAFSHSCQIETPIESVAEGTEVSIRVLIKAKGMERVFEAGLQVAEYHSDPAELSKSLECRPFTITD